MCCLDIKEKRRSMRPVFTIFWLCLLFSLIPPGTGYFLGDSKAVLTACGEYWTLQDHTLLPLLFHMTVCVHVRVVTPGSWVAFSYSSPRAPRPDLGLEGDAGALYGWLLGVRHRFPIALSPAQWHRVCLRRDVLGDRFSLKVNSSLVAERTVIAQAIPPGGSLRLGCRSRNMVTGNVIGQLELYMFRVWADLMDHEPCEDGSVIGWDSRLWGVTSGKAMKRDVGLLCGDHRRVRRDVGDNLSASTVGQGRDFPPTSTITTAPSTTTDPPTASIPSIIALTNHSSVYDPTNTNFTPASATVTSTLTANGITELITASPEATPPPDSTLPPKASSANLLSTATKTTPPPTSPTLPPMSSSANQITASTETSPPPTSSTLPSTTKSDNQISASTETPPTSSTLPLTTKSANQISASTETSPPPALSTLPPTTRSANHITTSTETPTTLSTLPPTTKSANQITASTETPTTLSTLPPTTKSANQISASTETPPPPILSTLPPMTSSANNISASTETPLPPVLSTLPPTTKSANQISASTETPPPPVSSTLPPMTSSANNISASTETPLPPVLSTLPPTTRSANQISASTEPPPPPVLSTLLPMTSSANNISASPETTPPPVSSTLPPTTRSANQISASTETPPPPVSSTLPPTTSSTNYLSASTETPPPPTSSTLPPTTNSATFIQSHFSTTPPTSITTMSTESPLVHCNLTQLCSNQTFYWVLIDVEATGANKSEADILNWVAGLFTTGACGLGSGSANASVTPGSSSGESLLMCQGHTQGVEVTCDKKQDIRRSNCSVLLQLSQTVSVCSVKAALQRGGAGVQVTVLGEVERVGRGLCMDTAPSNGGFVKCTSSSPLEDVCQTDTHTDLTCSLLDPGSRPEHSYVPPNQSCERNMEQQTCNCSFFCNNPSGLYAFSINITSPNITASHIETMMSNLNKVSPCNNLPPSLCEGYSLVSSIYQAVHLECHGTDIRLYSCMVLLQLSKPVQDICNFTDVIKSLLNNNPNIIYDRPVMRMVLCGSLGLLNTNLTWGYTPLSYAQMCQSPPLLPCQKGETLAMLLTDSCLGPPPDPVSANTSPQPTFTKPNSENATTSKNADRTSISPMEITPLKPANTTQQPATHTEASKLNTTQLPTASASMTTSTNSPFQLNTTGYRSTSPPDNTASTPDNTTTTPDNTSTTPGNTTATRNNTTTTPRNTTLQLHSTTSTPDITTPTPGNTTLQLHSTTSTPDITTPTTSNTTFHNTTTTPDKTTVNNTATTPDNTTPHETNSTPDNTTATPNNTTTTPDNSTLSSTNSTPDIITSTAGNTTITPSNTTLPNTTFTPDNTSTTLYNTTIPDNTTLHFTTTTPDNTTHDNITSTPGNTTTTPDNSTLSSTISTTDNITWTPGNTTITPSNIIQQNTTTAGNTTITPGNTTASSDNTTATPGNRTITPNNSTASPGNATIIPGNTTTSPDNTTATPGNTTITPNNSTASPGNVTIIPGNTTASPDNTTATPGNTTITPNNSTANPGNTTATPGNTTITPNNSTASPGNATIIPGNTTANPDNTTATPGNATIIQGNTTASPDNTSVTPGNTTITPNNSTASPGNVTIIPGNTTASPDNTTATPGNTTITPDNSTASPGNATATPGNTTITPDNSTASPRNITIISGNTTASPDNTTTTPGTTTATPGNTTITPNNSTASPGNATIISGNTTTSPDNTTATPGNATIIQGNSTTSPGNTTATSGNTTITPVNTTLHNTTSMPDNTTYTTKGPDNRTDNTTIPNSASFYNTTFYPSSATVNYTTDTPGNTTVNGNHTPTTISVSDNSSVTTTAQTSQNTTTVTADVSPISNPNTTADFNSSINTTTVAPSSTIYNPIRPTDTDISPNATTAVPIINPNTTREPLQTTPSKNVSEPTRTSTTPKTAIILPTTATPPLTTVTTPTTTTKTPPTIVTAPPTTVSATPTTATAPPTSGGTAQEQEADQLSQMTQGQLNSSQVELVVSRLEQLLQGPNISKSVGQKALTVISNLMAADPTAISASANRLVKAVDSLGLKLDFEGNSGVLSTASLALAVTRVDGTSFQGASFSISSPNSLQVSAGGRAKRSVSPMGSVSLPSSLTEGLSPQEQLLANRVQFTFYQNANLFKDRGLGERKVISPVLGSSVANLSISGLRENIKFTLRNTDPPGNFTASCVFWDFTLNDFAGGWNSTGCSLVNTTDEDTTCSCNHLTSFAILLDLSQHTDQGVRDKQQALILTFITYIGCGLSAIFLSVTLLTYLSFQKLRRDTPSKILIQLCLSLLLLNLLFLLDGWLALYPATGLCTSTAFFLHYFLLTSFTWTGLEALHMYLSIVRVFTPYLSRYMLKLSLLGWGLPLVVVVVVIAVDKDNYGIVTYGKYTDGSTDDFCWIRNTLVFYVGVVAYFLLVFVLSVVVFIVVMVQLARVKKQNPQNVAPNRGLMSDLRSIAGLIILLGLTWGFALFAWGDLYLPFIYLFTIFNSLQGFFIFVFHCAVKDSVRKQWRTFLCCGRLRLAENSDWSRTATHRIKQQSVTSATNVPLNSPSRSPSLISDATTNGSDSGISETSNRDVILNNIQTQGQSTPSGGTYSSARWM
ncbi:adhesion G-protein coupled receptor G4 isoform X2 [Osmerus mordax]|uniref:adhesion G-protein coupled receptor G4 isoform X2 n=1 Tax=Osmerus mordax TaxID=8014 RepID=UPI00350EB59C